MLRRLVLFAALAAAAMPVAAQERASASGASSGGEVAIARVHYGGGGDWYSGDPLPTLIAYARAHTLLDLDPEPHTVDLESDRLFGYPFLYLNGHGSVAFTPDEAARLRRYLDAGGFLYVNDDYGLDETIRAELRKVYPDQELAALPTSHPLYHAHFDFPAGLPKVHEHDGRPAEGLGLFHEGRLVVFYAFQSDLADGWEPAGTHPDPPEVREAALRMGVNLLVYAMSQGTGS
ncbi:MAG TPA: DUF4159 domain-containing protein [Rubricoccaceae bacterium]|jgi:hypothetical protein